MGVKLKRVLGMWQFLVLIDGAALATIIVSVFFIPNLWGILFGSSFLALGFYWYYVRYVKNKAPQYPLVPPEGKADFYLPRTNIPRPVIADFREADERRRKLDKIKKMNRKKIVRKKR